MSEKILLTISILISNRPDTVEKCLKSLDSLRSKVPCELILTDTGCGEAVRKLIEPYADVLLEFEWCNDFAKARNFGLERARGEWFLYLDDDEWFEDTGEIEEFFLSGAYRKYDEACYIQRNYSDRQGKLYLDAHVGRIAKLGKDVRFQYSIHEAFGGKKGRVRNLGSYVHHYGYIFDSEEERRKHARRNIVPLLEEHKKDKKNLRHNLQLAQEYNGLKEYDQSLEISLEGIQNYVPCKASDYYISGLYVNIVHCYMKKYEYERAEECAESYWKLIHLNELTRAALKRILAGIYFKLEKYEQCIGAVSEYLCHYDKQQEKKEFYLHFETIFLYDCFDAKRLHSALSDGIQAAIHQKDADTAFHFFKWFRLKDEVMLLDSSLIPAIVKAYVTAERTEGTKYGAMLRGFAEREPLKNTIAFHLRALYQEDAQMLETSEADWEEMKDMHWIFTYQNLRYAWKHRNDGTEQEVDFAGELARIWENAETVLPESMAIGMWDFMDVVGMNIAFVQKIAFHRWQTGMEGVFRIWKQEMLEQFYNRMELFAETGEIRYAFWRYRYAERRLLMLEKEKDNDLEQEEMLRLLQEYVYYSNQVYRQLYHPQLFQEQQDLLPKQAQIAVKVMEIEALVEEANYKKAVSELKELYGLAPKLSNTIKAYGHRVQEKLGEQERKQAVEKQEMDSLKRAVLENVKVLIREQEYSSAMSVLNQLEQMTGVDESILSLRQLCEEAVVGG